MIYLSPARAVAFLAATSIAALTISQALAQQPPQPATPRPAAPAPQRPAAGTPPRPAQAQPAPQARPPGQPGQQADPGAASAAPQLIFSQWLKFCFGQDGQPVDQKDAAAKAKQLCYTAIEGRLESGVPIVAVATFDPPADGKKTLRLTLPVGLALPFGTRIIVDGGQPLTAPFQSCFANACIADYELNPDFLGKLKKGKAAVVQAIRYDNNPISVQVPLTEFAKIFDGAPADPKVLEEQQKKLEDELKRKGEELQKKADDARKRLEQGGGAKPPQ